MNARCSSINHTVSACTRPYLTLSAFPVSTQSRGNDPAPLLAHLPAAGGGAAANESTVCATSATPRFDRIILSDVLFNRQSHRQLLATCAACLAQTGVVWCTFSHHDPLKVRNGGGCSQAKEAQRSSCFPVVPHTQMPSVRCTGASGHEFLRPCSAF